MKRIYTWMPKNVADKVKNFLEYDGGAADTPLLRASADCHPRYGPVYRPPPGSQPQARIPAGPLDRTYDIKYYTRDVRRGPRVNSRPIEASFTKPDMLRGLTPPEPVLPAAIDVPAMKPLEGAMRNPDVERYDKSGLRVTMTANTAAYLKELAKHRANHLPQPVWNRQAAARAWMAAQEARGLPPVPGAPMAKRLSPWQYTHDPEW